MKWTWLGVVLSATGCIAQPTVSAPPPTPPVVAVVSKPAPQPLPVPGEATSVWSIHAFPRAALSIALPANGVNLDAKALRQTQALVASGVQLGGNKGTAYVILAYPLTKQPQGASVEQRLLLLPYLLDDLGQDAKRSPIDFEGLHGVEFETHKDAQYRRTRVYATAHTVVALIVSSQEHEQTFDSDARQFFESLQWYDD